MDTSCSNSDLDGLSDILDPCQGDPWSDNRLCCQRGLPHLVLETAKDRKKIFLQYGVPCKAICSFHTFCFKSFPRRNYGKWFCYLSQSLSSGLNIVYMLYILLLLQKENVLAGSKKYCFGVKRSVMKPYFLLPCNFYFLQLK